MTTQIKGNVGRQPESRLSKKGNPWTSFSVANTPRRKNDAGDWEDAGPTTWIKVKVFGDDWTTGRPFADEVAERVSKGMRVTVDTDAKGVFEDEPWTNRNGELVTDQVCIASRITLPDGSEIGMPSGIKPAERVKAEDTNPDNDPWASKADPWATPANDGAPF